MKELLTINPFTGKEIETYAFLSDAALQDKLLQAAQAYSQWSHTEIGARRSVIEEVCARLRRDKQRHAEIITTEMGKPIRESLSEIEKCLWLCEYFLAEAESFLIPREEDLGDKQILHLLEPIGAVLGIMPWNYPYWQVFRYAIPNLLLGNVVLLKHAPNSFGAALAIESLFGEAPQGVFQSLLIDIPLVESVIAHEIVQGVCVTGSARAGRAVASLAGKYLKKSVLELGGTDAFVLLDDAPLHAALDAAYSSRTGNAGQSCIAAKRIFVPQNSLDQATEYLRTKLEGIQLGDPMLETTDMGPISTAAFSQKLQRQVARAVAEGASLILGGQAKGAFFEPTLLVASADNPMTTEEIFGPVLTLIPYEKEDALLSAVNETDYGLGGAVWSADKHRAIQFARHMHTGAVAINSFMKSDPRVPFGGIKQSGYGREMGLAGFRAFANEKVVML